MRFINFISKELLNNLFQDREYKNYIDEYKKKSNIKLDKLKIIFNKHYDLYRLFIKINIFLYRYNTKLLDEDLQDFSQLNGRTLNLMDVDIIMKYYINNYKRCKKKLHRIAINHWVPPSEKRIINMIISRKIDNEIINI